MIYNRKKELIKNLVITTAILLIAVFSTYYIYNKFDHSEVVDYTSESLDITYKEDNGEQISITSVSPLTDSVGLSSTAHTVTIKNNLTEKANFKIQITDDIKAVVEDECSEYQIPKEDIRISVRVDNGETEIYNLSDLEDNIIAKGKVKALASKKYTIRVWVSSESTLPIGSNLHYHGLIEVVEDGE